MALREILTSEQPILRRKAHKVKTFDAALQKLIDDMIETMEDAPGQGLAAPQVGVALRVIVVDALIDDEDKESGVQLQLVNPEILKREGEQIGEEGCLSIPGYLGIVKRAMHVTVRATNRKGKEVKIKASKNLARVLQHEIDHLDGVLFTDRIASPKDLFKIGEKGERKPVFQEQEDPLPA